MPRSWRRASQASSAACLVALAVLAISQVRDGWWLQDADAYWQAAARLRDGAPLYPMLASQDAATVYRYAPWFAALWVPLTLLPQALAYALWEMGCLVGAVFCIWHVVRTGGIAAALMGLLMAALLIPAAASGNVQPILVGLLLFGLERRSGPLWIAVAASLKATPLLLVAVYVGRREWTRAGWTLALTAALTLPMLAFDLSHYPIDVAAAAGPLPAWLALASAAALTGAATWLARTRYSWLAASAAVLIAIPRWSYYQPTFLALGTTGREVKADQP